MKDPGFTFTVSLNPRSSGSGGIIGPVANRGRLMPAGDPVLAFERLLVRLDVVRVVLKPVQACSGR